jgi:excisionase family DNA binding protein
VRTTAIDRYLSLGEVGEQLGTSTQTVRRWVKAGELPAYKPGKEWRIRESDLAEFLEARSTPKVQAPLSPSEDEERRLPAPESMEELLEQVGATTRHLARTRDALRNACEGVPQDEVRQFYREVLTEKQQIGPVLDQRYSTPPGEELLRLNLLWREQFYKGWDAAGAVDRRLKEIATTESEDQAKALEEEAAKLASVLVSNAA